MVFAFTPARFFFALISSSAGLFALGGCGGGGSSNSTPTATPTPLPRQVSRPFPRRLACAGDSITFGVGVADTNLNSYGGVVARRLAEKYRVQRFGLPGATLLQNSALPYQKGSVYTAALGFKPDSALIFLGTNDATQASTSQVRQDFVDDYRKLIGDFRSQGNTTLFFLCIPPARFPLNGGLNGNIVRHIAPLINKIARESGAVVIDLHRITEKRPQMFPDGVHPNEAGARLIGNAIADAIERDDAQNP